MRFDHHRYADTAILLSASNEFIDMWDGDDLGDLLLLTSLAGVSIFPDDILESNKKANESCLDNPAFLVWLTTNRGRSQRRPKARFQNRSNPKILK
eukprot:g73015.t1